MMAMMILMIQLYDGHDDLENISFFLKTQWSHLFVSGCTKTVCGEIWHLYLQSLSYDEYKEVKQFQVLICSNLVTVK